MQKRCQMDKNWYNYLISNNYHYFPFSVWRGEITKFGQMAKTDFAETPETKGSSPHIS